MFHLVRTVVPLALAAALTLTGCSAPEATPSASSPVCQSSGAATGPATACLSDASIPTVTGSEPTLPATVTDVSGQAVTVANVDRVLALDISGTIAATIIGLGLADHLIGRDSSSNYAEIADLPVVTQGGHTLAAEPILALNPSVIITDGSIGPNRVLDQLSAAGIAVVTVTDERSIDAIDELTTQVAAALGVPDRALALNTLVDAGLARARSDVSTLAHTAPRTVFLYLRGTGSIYYLFGSESGADSLITAIGARDVASELGWQGMKPVTAEALVAAAPDVILVMTDGLASVGGVDGLLSAIPAVAQTPAGQQRRIIDMADSEILGFGPRTPAVLEALATAVHAGESQ